MRTPLAAALGLSLLLAAQPGASQVVLDGTIGEAGQVPVPPSPDGSITYWIDDELGAVTGPNLLFSFSEFAIQEGQSASFESAAPDTIDHVVARVTGSSISRIDGLLRSGIPGADLYLLNPHGVLFGQYATVEIPASLHVSTADYLRFGGFDGPTLATDPDPPPLLSVLVDPPTAFGFSTSTSGPLTVEARSLRFAAGSAFSLIGAEIDVAGSPRASITSPGGRIGLAGVASPGEVQLDDLSIDTFGALGRVRLNGAHLDVGSPAGAGEVDIRADHLSLEDSSIRASSLGAEPGAPTAIDLGVDGALLLRDSVIQAGSAGAGRSGAIRIRADALVLQEESVVEVLSVTTGDTGDILIDGRTVEVMTGSEIATRPRGGGTAGAIDISSSILRLETGGRIIATTLAGGDSGGIRIVADEVYLSSDDAFRTTSLEALNAEESSGNAGSIVIRAGDLAITDGGFIEASAVGMGTSGGADIEATRVLLSGRSSSARSTIASRSQGTGAARPGGVRLSAESLEIRGGGQISTTAIDGNGDPGPIEVSAGSILLTQKDEQGAVTGLATGIFSRSANGSNSVDFSVAADTLTIEDGAAISSSTRGTADAGDIHVEAGAILLTGTDPVGHSSGIFAQVDSSSSTGAGGRVVVTADSLEIRDGGKISATTIGEGRGGELELRVDSILITGSPAGISSGLRAASKGNGEGGRIRIIDARSLQVLDGGTIFAASIGAGDSGNIEIDAESIRISGVDPASSEFVASIVASSHEEGDAGDIVLRVDELQILNGGQIHADSSGPGNAGSISVTAGSVLIDGEGHTGDLGTGLFAIAGSTGQAGSISVDAETVTLRDQSWIMSNTIHSEGGDIEITAGEMSLTGRSALSAESWGPGAAGDIDVHVTRDLTLAGTSVVNALSSDQLGLGIGDAGSVQIDVGGRFKISDAFVSTLLFGDSDTIGGDIDISAGRLEMTQGALLSASSFGLGSGGNITLTIADDLQLSGGSRISARAVDEGAGTRDAGRIEIDVGGLMALDESWLAATVEAMDGAPAGGATPRGGDINVEAGGLAMSRSSEISAESSGPGIAGGVTIQSRGPVELSGESRIVASAADDGDAGGIALTAPSIRLEDGAEILAEVVDGQGGDVALSTQTLTIDGGGSISARSDGAGRAGRVEISSSGSAQLFGGSSITTEAPHSDGGDIELSVAGTLLVRDSEVSASVGGGTGGNITIDPEFVILDNGRIVARAGTGAGGSIDITTEYFVPSAESLVSATSDSGIDGTVIIRSPDVELSASLASLPEKFLDSSALLQDRCATRAGGRVGSFVVEGWDGTADTPDRPRTTRYSISADREHRRKAVERRGDLEGAIQHWRTAVAALEDAADGGAFADALLQLAQAYEAAGQISRARKVLERAHAAAGRVSGPRAIPAVLGARARLRALGGDPASASEDFEAAIQLAAAAADRRLLAQLHLDRGTALLGRGQVVEAIEAYRQAQELAGPDELSLLAAIRANLGTALIEVKEFTAAQAALDESIRDVGQLDASHETLFTMLHLGRACDRIHEAPSRGRDSLRIDTGALFARAARLAQEIEDPLAASYAWGYLGALYDEESRQEEAVELTRRALVAAQAAESAESLYLWQWQLGKLRNQRGQTDAALDAYRAAQKSLRQLRFRAALRAETQHAFAREFPVEPLVTELVDVLLQRASFTEDPAVKEKLLLEARQHLEDLKATELQDYFQDECVAAQRTAVPDAIPGAVVIYPVPLPDRTELIVSLPQGMKSFLAPIDSVELTTEVHRLRQLLEKRATHEYREPAGKLYDWLIRPLEPDLKANRAEVLIFVSGGALRSIPMTALYDRKEKKFLVEKYPIVITPGLTLIEPRKIDLGELQLLKGGLTQSVRGYPALAYVGEELEAIEEAFGGTTLLNERFVVPAIDDALESQPFGVVHLASHGEFGGDPENTFLVTFDGRLKMGELTEMVGATRFREKALEILALSACETAAGDDRAALGLAGVAVKAGARSTLATLWRINDRASAQLVAEFYRQLSDPEVSRAVALQRAQLRLLEQPGFRHPAYWSPFILVGSWL